MKNYSKRLIDVIEYSREEAARLQNSYIGPEHLMLGIIREGEGEAMRDIRMMTKMTRTKVSLLVVRHLAPLPVLEREPLNRNPLMIHLFWITSERI